MYIEDEQQFVSNGLNTVLSEGHLVNTGAVGRGQQAPSITAKEEYPFKSKFLSSDHKSKYYHISNEY